MSVAFEMLKKQVMKIVELKHFDVHRDIRIVCDARNNGLWAVLEQLGSEGWRPISFASQFLNGVEKKYSTNELEVLQLSGAQIILETTYLVGNIQS